MGVTANSNHFSQDQNVQICAMCGNKFTNVEGCSNEGHLNCSVPKQVLPGHNACMRLGPLQQSINILKSDWINICTDLIACTQI